MIALLLVGAAGVVGGGSVSFGWVSGWSLTMIVLGVARGFVEVALVVTVTALAGLAVSTFDGGTRSPESDAPEPSGPSTLSVRDD